MPVCIYPAIKEKVWEKRKPPAYTWWARTCWEKQGHVSCGTPSQLCSLLLSPAKWSPHYPFPEPPTLTPSQLKLWTRQTPQTADPGCSSHTGYVLRLQHDSLKLPLFLGKLDGKRNQEFRALEYRSRLSLGVQQSQGLRRQRQENSKFSPGYLTILRPARVCNLARSYVKILKNKIK